ncbi:MAG: TolC family protein [Myxococcota bacterium]
MESAPRIVRAGLAAIAVLLGARAEAAPIAFDEACRAAMERAPEVLLGQADVAVAAADIETEAALPNPTLGVASATRTARLSTSLALPMALFGQRLAAARAARRDRDVAALDLALARLEARWGAAEAWIALWQAQAQAAILSAAVADASAVLKVAETRYDAGSGARVDIVQAKATLARAEAERAAGDGAIAAASARLARWLGRDPSEDLIAAGDPPDPGTALAPLDALRQRLAGHPALARDAGAEAAARAHEAAERRQRWPLVEAQVTVNQFDPSFSGAELVVGLALELPVFDRRDGPIARARAEEARASASAALDAERLDAEATAAWREAETARRRLAALARDVLPAAREVAAMTREGFASGRLDLLRVLEADQAVRQAQADELEARAAWARALAALEHAVGDAEALHAP